MAIGRTGAWPATWVVARRAWYGRAKSNKGGDHGAKNQVISPPEFKMNVVTGCVQISLLVRAWRCGSVSVSGFEH